MNAILEEVRIGIHVVWRRRWLALAVAWGIALVGWLGVSLIPNTYESTARIFLEPQSILPQAVGITSNDQQQGIDSVRQTLLSSDNLASVVKGTDLARQGDALGPAVEHHLGADVDGDTGDLVAAQLAAHPVRLFQDEHVVSGGDQVVRRTQSRDPGTHHDDPAHPSSLPAGSVRR